MTTQEAQEANEYARQNILTLTSDPATPPEVLSAYYLACKAGSPDVVALIATNPNTPIAILNEMIEESPGRAVLVLENPAFGLLVLSDPTFSEWSISALMPLYTACLMSPEWTSYRSVIMVALKQKTIAAIKEMPPLHPNCRCTIP